MSDLFDVEKSLGKVGRFIIDKLREELINQGHENTGRLISELRYDIVKDADGFTLQIFMDKYGIFVNNGVTGSRIAYNRGSGAKNSLYIQALMEWIRQKGIESGDREVKNFAFAIANKHKKEGMPTSGSSRFSKNGRRTGFIDDTIEKNSFEVANELTFDIGNSVEIFFDNLVRKTNGNNN